MMLGTGILKALNRAITAVILLPVHGYRVLISPLIGANCRFQPSCSSYTIEAIQLHGIIKGGYLAAKRIGKCHPWGGSGFDPVPQKDACKDDVIK